MIDPKMLELSVYDGIPHLLAPVVTEPRQGDRRAEMDGARDGATATAPCRSSACATSPATTSASPRRARKRRGADPPRADRLRPRDRQAGLRGPAARPRAAAADRGRRRRDGRPDDGRRQGDRGRGPAPGADGARGRHPPDHGDAAAVGRRHHRHHQGQLPDPHQLPGHLARSTAAPSWASRAPSSCWARATCSTWPAAAASPACTARSSPTTRSRRWCDFLREPGRAGLYRGGHRGRGRGRRHGDAAGRSAATGDGEAALYDQAVALVAREGKASTSFIQRHLQIGYNRAAKLIEQMEKEGVVGPANHVGKREVLHPARGNEPRRRRGLTVRRACRCPARPSCAAPCPALGAGPPAADAGAGPAADLPYPRRRRDLPRRRPGPGRRVTMPGRAAAASCAHEHAAAAWATWWPTSRRSAASWSWSSDAHCHGRADAGQAPAGLPSRPATRRTPASPAAAREDRRHRLHRLAVPGRRPARGEACITADGVMLRAQGTAQGQQGRMEAVASSRPRRTPARSAPAGLPDHADAGGHVPSPASPPRPAHACRAAATGRLEPPRRRAHIAGT